MVMVLKLYINYYVRITGKYKKIVKNEKLIAIQLDVELLLHKWPGSIAFQSNCTRKIAYVN